VTSTPSFSLIVTTFDLPSAILRECLESIVVQTETRWEAIVVDDGSVDDSAEMVVEQMRDARIRLVRHEVNSGLGAARNTGIRQAAADLIIPVDGDDRLQPRFIEITSGALQEHPDADWAFADWQCFGASTDVWRFPVPMPPPCPEHLVIPGAGALVRRGVWTAVGGYLEDANTSGVEDWDFWIGAMERGLSGVHVPLPLYFHRRRSDSMSVTASVLNDHVNREVLYRRHRETFDSFSGDCPRCPPKHRVASFRSRGYVTSAAASLSAGDRRTALRLAARGALLRPSRTSLRQLVRTMLPKRRRTGVPAKNHGP
jgi:glycosyltransferase involved in cell wall biosynthesis